MSDSPKDQTTDDASATKPAEHHVCDTEPLRAFVKEYKESNRKNEANERKKFFWEKIVAGGVSVYTLLTLGILIISLCQLQTSRDTETRQLRAYVHYRAGEINLMPPNGYVGVVAMKNWGQTPAYQTLSWINVDAREYPLRTNLDIRAPDNIPNDVGPGAEFELSHISQVQLTTDDLAAIRAGTKAIYVWGTVIYVDAFKNRRHTDFYYRGDREVSPGRWNLKTIRSEAN